LTRAHFVTSGNHDRQYNMATSIFLASSEIYHAPKIILSECRAPVGFVLQPCAIWGLLCSPHPYSHLAREHSSIHRPFPLPPKHPLFRVRKVARDIGSMWICCVAQDTTLGHNFNCGCARIKSVQYCLDMVVPQVRQERRRTLPDTAGVPGHRDEQLLTRFRQTYPLQPVVLIAAPVYCKWLPPRLRFCAYYLALKWCSVRAPNSSSRVRQNCQGHCDRRCRCIHISGVSGDFSFLEVMSSAREAAIGLFLRKQL
jgi:hypothetical protein